MARRRSVGAHVGFAIAAGVFVSACGGAAAPPSVPPASVAAVRPGIPSAEPATASPPETTSPATTAPSAPEASTPVTVDLGEVGVTPLGSRVTVHSFGPSDRSPEPPAGSNWLETDLEWCLPEEATREVTLGNLRYEVALELDDGTTISPDSHADSPDEVYASDGTFGPGECVRGALVFAVPTGATPAYLLLVGRNGAVRWRLA